jgi:DNA-directed RNA polymerase II subunit RPB1
MKQDVSRISSYLKYVSINDLKSNEEIYYSPYKDSNSLSQNLKNDNVSNAFFINNIKDDVNTLPYIIRLELSREKLLEKNITLLDIKTKFVTYWMNNFSDFKNIKKQTKSVIQYITKCAILSNQDTSVTPIIHIRFSTTKLDYNILTSFMSIILNEITLKGLDNINSIDYVPYNLLKFNNTTGDIKLEENFIVYTDGINMIDIKYIRGIDHTKTICNDIETVLKFYGIEAARSMLLNELNDSYAGAGLHINYHHYTILVDVMTHTGGITSIDRHGINRLDTDPLTRASFERQIEHLINAAIFNESDYMRSVSSRIMAGHVIKGGTGMFDILLNTDMIENSEYLDDELGGYVTVQPLEEDIFIHDTINKDMAFNDTFIPV